MITIRRPRLSFPAALDPMLIEGRPELSYALVGLSLVLPYVEPYLIRTMAKAKRQVRDPELLEAIAGFNGQEGQHARQHERFNEAIRARYPELAALEAEIAADYQRFSETRDLRWNLAYAEGFESLTSALACYLFEEELLQGAQPAARDLFEWHILEELEHRCVAFDVYQHLYGGYAYRLAVGLSAQRHLGSFVLRATRLMLELDRRAGRDHGGAAAALRRLGPLLASMARGLAPKVAATHAPWYTPHRLVLPAGIDEVLQRMTMSCERPRGGARAAVAPAPAGPAIPAAAEVPARPAAPAAAEAAPAELPAVAVRRAG